MKSFLMSVIVFFLACNFVVAQPVTEELIVKLMPSSEAVDVGDWLEKVPNLKQGAVYSLKDSKIKYCSTMEIAELWKKVTFELGGIPIDNELIAVASYEVAKVKDYGVTLPLLNLIELNVGGYVGIKDLGEKNKFDYGVSATLVNLKF